MTPTFLDFEASGLDPQSYPIQVGWTASYTSADCIYIRPVESWTYWSLEAEAIHGLPPRLLSDVGRPVAEVAERLNQALEGQTVYCDGLPWDRHWLDRLFEAGG